MNLTLPSPTLQRNLSLFLTFVFLIMILLIGLLPGLLAVAFSYVLSKNFQPGGEEQPPGKWTARAAALVVSLIPWVAGMIFFKMAHQSLPSLYQELQGLFVSLGNFLAAQREALPESLSQFLPPPEHFTQSAAELLKSQAGVLAQIGQGGLGILLQIIVGFIIGPMIFLSEFTLRQKGVLEAEIAKRARSFGQTFKAIVMAQFFIALINTAATAIYLLIILPLFSIELPYKLALLSITFVASLIPIAGNIFCNTLLTIVSFTVGPGVALASLIFLILVHKSEYFISASVVGGRTNILVWELLAVIFISEALFGIYGILAGPLYYAYLRNELVTV